MKLGFVTAILPEMSFEDVLKTASEIGYDCVEVMCWPPGKAERRYAGVTHIDAVNIKDETLQDIQGLIRLYGVNMSGLGYYPNPLSPDQTESKVAVEHLKKVIIAAKYLGVDVVNTFIGRNWERSVDDNWPEFLKTWRPLIAFAEEQGIKIGIENCPMIFTRDEWPGGKNLFTTPSIWKKAFNDIKSDHFGLNFDPSHFIWQQMDYLKAISTFGDKFFHVHAKDVRMDKDRLDEVGIMGYPIDFHTPKLPGMGDVNWGKFFSVLTDSGYDGSVCVEVEDRAFEGALEKRIESLKMAYGFLRQFIPKS